MKEVVIDASVALAWCFPDEKSAYAERVLEGLEGRTVLVPAVWALEVANGLLVGERRKRIGQADILRFAELLEAVAVQEIALPLSAHIGSVLPLAREYKLSAYDASYLDMAMRSGAELATADEALETAARSAGVPMMTPRTGKGRRRG